jgi:hypothetical protein
MEKLYGKRFNSQGSECPELSENCSVRSFGSELLTRLSRNLGTYPIFKNTTCYNLSEITLSDIYYKILSSKELSSVPGKVFGGIVLYSPAPTPPYLNVL